MHCRDDSEKARPTAGIAARITISTLTKVTKIYKLPVPGRQVICYWVEVEACSWKQIPCANSWTHIIVMDPPPYRH